VGESTLGTKCKNFAGKHRLNYLVALCYGLWDFIATWLCGGGLVDSIYRLFSASATYGHFSICPCKSSTMLHIELFLALLLMYVTQGDQEIPVLCDFVLCFQCCND
jgi:hypothetical protein